MKRVVRGLMADKRYIFIVSALVILFFAKFFLPLIQYGIPLGYDVGIYRYLFIRHAEGFPPFSIADLDPWAKSHPLGLFMFTSLLINAGIPADWFIGWMWNAVPVVVVGLLAVVTGAKKGKLTGMFVLVAGLVSVAYFDGFAAMYWKTYAALFWMVLAFAALERKSWIAVIPGILTVVTHHQTGLVFALSVGTWWVVALFSRGKSPLFRRATIIGFAAAAIAAAMYVPVWKQAIWNNILSLMTQSTSEETAGTFPSVLFYARVSGILLAAGAYGFFRSLNSEKPNMWHYAVLWSLVYIALRLFFYRRFFLQLDFFLLPFAAAGMADVWRRFSGLPYRAAIIALVIAQAFVSYEVMAMRVPDIDRETFAIVQSLQGVIPDGATVLSLENQSAGWLLGWLPHATVAGPGLFNVSWTREQWEEMLYGNHEQRVELLRSLGRSDIYFVLTPIFYDHYQHYALEFLNDPCFEKIEGQPLAKVVC